MWDVCVAFPLESQLPQSHATRLTSHFLTNVEFQFCQSRSYFFFFYFKTNYFDIFRSLSLSLAAAAAAAAAAASDIFNVPKRGLVFWFV